MSQQYANPPVVEAACDFRFIPNAPWDSTIPGLLYTGLRRLFPERRNVPRVEASLAADHLGLQGRITSGNLTQFARRDGTAVVTVGSNQVTISRLRPYEGWPEFEHLIARVLDRYIKVASPHGFARIGLRYINRLVIPGEVVDLSHYLDIFPHVGTNLPDQYGDFAILMMFPYQDGRDMLRVQLDSFTNNRSPRPEASTFDFDLDYVLAQAEAIAIGDAMEWVEQAHTSLETAFEAVIRDPLRQLLHGEGER